MLLGAILALFFLQQVDHQTEAEKAMRERQYTVAITHLQKAVEADPKDYAAQFNLALAQSLAGLHAEAAAGFRKALELKPDLYEAQLNLGMVLLDLKQPAEAVKTLRAAQAAQPKEFTPNQYLAEAMLASGDAAGAEQQFRAALEIDPKSAPAASGLASALMAQDKLSDAEAAILRAADLDPSYRDALLGLGQRYEDRKQYAAAIAIYKQFPDNPAVRERLGNLLLEDGHPEEAIPHLEAVVKASPTPANRYALAIAQLRAGNAAEAEQTMQAALATDPRNSELRLAYAGLLRDRKSFQAAAQQFYQVTQTVPDSKPAWTGFATMLLMLENYPQAVTAFDRLEALGEPNPAIYFFRALANDHLRQFKPALADYTKFLSLSKEAHPDEEFKARQRVQAIQKELEK